MYFSLFFSFLKRVQRRFLSSTAYVLKTTHPRHDYRSVLYNLGLISLADRRLETNLIFLRESLNILYVNASYLLFQIKLKVPSRSTKSYLPFVVHTYNTKYGRNHPIDRTMRIINYYYLVKEKF